MRTAIRILVALTLMVWGQLALGASWFSEVYYNIPFASPHGACEFLFNNVLRTRGSFSLTPEANYFRCKFEYQTFKGSPWYTSNYKVYSQTPPTCPNGIDPLTGQCTDAPQDCTTTTGQEILKTQTCQYNTSLKLAVCDDQVAFEGCKYTAGGKKSCVSILENQTYQCTGSFYGSGESNGTAPDTCTGDDCAQPKPDDPKSNCVSANGVETCFDPKKPGCGSINGIEGCFQEEPGCGYFNGTYRCMEAEKPNRNCGYFNGKQVCYDPNDPTKQIPESSSDHPKNGGNADGDDTNDPRPSKGEGSNSQGSDQGATNEAIEELGEKLGPKIDKTNDLLDGISGKFDQLLDGLFGDEYDGQGTGTDGDAEGAGQGAGEGLAGLINQEGAALLEGRDQEAKQYLEQLPGMVERSWFGSEGEKVGLNNILDKVLPSAAGCGNYTIAFALGKYSTSIVIPVCELTRIKPLLEWLIWMLTFVGLWKIFYAGLRQEDAKAAKGGF